jgi:dihydroxyacetone kinase
LSRLFDPAASKLRMAKGDRLVIVVNNLGGLSKLEELIVLWEAIKQIRKRNYYLCIF